MERIILFDIDKTIFDTRVSGERATVSIGSVARISPDEIERINGEYKSQLHSTTDFDSSDFLREVSTQTGSKLEELTGGLFDQNNFVLYPETLETLERLSSEGYSLGTFSEGVREWQMKKLTLTGAIDYFNPSLILIKRRKLSPESIDEIPKGSTVVDDKKEVIKTLRHLRPDLKLVWVNRQDQEELDISQIMTIENLSDLLAIY